MTHDQSEISQTRQIYWYYTSYLPRNKRGEIYAYLLEIPFQTLEKRTLVQDSLVLGFGILSKRKLWDGEHETEKRWTVTGGLIPSARGMGFGKMIFRFLSSMPKEDVWLDVWETNTVAINLYKKIGYEEVNEFDSIVTMRLPR